MTFSRFLDDKNHRILVVDDNEAIHEDFKKILIPGSVVEDELSVAESEIFGSPAVASALTRFELDFAFQGQEALQLVKRAMDLGDRYAMVFMDMRMPPGWGGLETTLRLWEVDPDLQIVICTAYSDISWGEMFTKLGNTERVLILKKPFDSVEVLQLAHSLTEKWVLLQASRRNVHELETTVRERTQQLAEEVAEHKLAAQQVKEQAMLLENAHDAIFVWDLDGDIRFWNHGAELLYGWSREEALGGRATEALFSMGAGTEMDVAREHLLAQGEWQGELTQQTKRGETVAVDCRWSLVRDSHGEPRSIFAICADITVKKQLEAKFLRVQRMESIGTLAGGIAHDLNNILQPITMGMHLLREQCSDPSSRDLLDLINNNTQRATSLVSKVLSFARGVEGQRVTIEPATLVEEIASLVRETFPRDIKLQFSADEDTWPLLGDPTQLHQVFLNLCVNARDAMPDGGLLSISTHNVEVSEQKAALYLDATPGRHVMLRVADEGMGVSPALLEKIFDPFFTTKEQGKGTGLGLSTTLSIVRSHGGFISVRSVEGRGTIFEVFVPAGEVEPPKISQAPLAKIKKENPGGNRLLLVVDDEEQILNVMRQTLQLAGFRVVTASNGEEGLAAYRTHRGEIAGIITDMMMPVMDGGAMISELKRSDPHCKVMAISGMTSDASVQMISRLGVQNILAKPFAVKELLQAVHELVGPMPGAAKAPSQVSAATR